MLFKKIVLFIACIAGAFVYICNAIPQLKNEPVTEQSEIGDSPQELQEAGRRIFMSDRAQCLTCHSLGKDPKARCPDQEGLGERAASRKPGISAAEYLVESVYDPNAFIVPGYPANQMTPVNKPPIALSHEEILAVLAYLNTLAPDGKENTDQAFIDELKREQEFWIKGLRVPDQGQQRVPLPVFPGDAQQGYAVFSAQPCVQCHRVGEEGQDIGPDLTAIGATQGAQYILESLFEPSAVIVKGYMNTYLFWEDDGDQEFEMGVPVEWKPDKEHAEVLVLAIQEGGETNAYEYDLVDVQYAGDTTVAIEQDDDVVVVCGDYVSGDEQTGVVLSVFADGQWTEREIPPAGIVRLNLPTSPMPANFLEELTPRDVYDLLAFLLEQKGTGN